MNNHKKSSLLIAVVLGAMLMFAIWYPLMQGGVVLFSTDDNIGLLSGCARGLPATAFLNDATDPTMSPWRRCTAAMP